ncbi:IclR family transcriptional regulator [Oleispirillum naphthae]|uniref:IclR family transcriptional regulator n=1 Tax=Oleispirillum naphthae TaxID=2838853 RepID=UPI0030825716
MENRRNPVGRTLQLVSFMAENDPARAWGVRELASRMGIPLGAIHRALVGLEEQGWVERGDGGSYTLSLEVFRMAMSLSSSLPLRRAALPVMHEITVACSETALLGMFDHSRLQMSFIAQVESPHPLRYAIDLNRWSPIHAGATGLAIFAFLEPEVQEAVFARGDFTVKTENTITAPARLREELAMIRARGYALTKGQRILGSVGVAAPIFGPSGAVIGDLAITLPTERFERVENPEILAASVVRHADKISQKLRWK